MMTGVGGKENMNDHYNIEDPYELIEEMTKALEEAMETQKRYSEVLDKLKNENQFLADTILNDKLGLITTERREIIDENRRLKEVIVLLLGCLKKEYSGRRR